MTLMHRIRPLAAVFGLVAALCLGACTIGPVELPDLPDLPDLPQLPIGTQESVDEAKAARAASTAQTVADSDLHVAGTLTVGVLASSTAPFSISEDDGTLTGIDVDTAYALADELGLSAVSVVSVTDVASGLAAGCDVVMGVPAGTGDAEYTVIGNYAQSVVGVFSSTQVTAPIDAATLAGKTVALQAGSATQLTFSGLSLGATESGYANLNECFDAMEAGSADYVVCDAYAGAYLAEAYDNAYFAGTIDTATAMGIAVSNANSNLQTAVQSALDAIQTNGVANLAKARWVGSLPVLGESTKLTNLSTGAVEGEAVESTETGE